MRDEGAAVEYDKARGKLRAQLLNGIAIWCFGAGTVGLPFAIAIARPGFPNVTVFELVIAMFAGGVLLHLFAADVLRGAYGVPLVQPRWLVSAVTRALRFFRCP